MVAALQQPSKKVIAQFLDGFLDKADPFSLQGLGLRQRLRPVC